MIGRTISHYKVTAELGRGGMAVVYKAEDTKLERTVALKFLASHLLEDEESHARFIREAKAAASLDHQNICTIHEIDEVEGQTFIAMAYIEGQSVKDKIAERPLKLDEALDIAIQTAQGLKAAHQKEIVHRDIKPANLMLTEEGQVKVMDFGLAQLAEQSRLTKTATMLGTPAYMSPEQSQRLPTGRRTDIWSLGVVIYEMVTGRLPFEGERQEAVLYAIGAEDPEPITALRAGLPMELERIIGKAMAKDAEERYQHVDEMLVDLRSLRQQIESRPRRPSATRPKLVPRGWPNRVAGLVTLLVVLIAGALYLSRHKQPEVQLGPAGTTETSVAVLPLGNLSGDPEQQYFSDGMTEALITELSKIEALRLISRTSVMRYKGTDKSLPEIARELNVGVIVEGSVLLVGNQVRITAQLIDAATDTHLWAESYDRDLGNVLALHSEVALAVAGEIRVKLTPREEARFGSARPINTEAYDLYWRGKDLLNEFSEQAFKNSIQPELCTAAWT